MCPRFLFVDTTQSAHKGHHPHSHIRSTHGRNRTLTLGPLGQPEKAMGHESQIELWSPNLTRFCFVGFGIDRLRRQEAMKTASRENPNHRVALPRNRAHGALSQNRSRSPKWAEQA